MVSSQGVLTAAAYGAVLCLVQDIGAGELWGVLVVLRHCMPPIAVKTDCELVVTGFRRGRAWCCCSARPFAEVWRLVWRKIDDLGLEAVCICKVKAHASVGDVEAGRLSLVDRAGNTWADRYAKKGAALRPVDCSVQLALRRTETVLSAVGRWIGEANARVAKLGDVDAAKLRARKAEAEAVGPILCAAVVLRGWNGHRLQKQGGQWACAVCARRAKQEHLLRRQKCAGMPTVAAKAHASHRLWQSQGYTWCSGCGA
ncbi:unnamed protein product [Polarella glacialis]|uniref:RNase H type-1 domain-containing protein n=1 Tax=Polarella glacialis TaxID=89957 RepID=A0A813DNZ7_POLGL|nr:unnamed protein product [Polarella glacialis]